MGSECSIVELRTDRKMLSVPVCRVSVRIHVELAVI
jgi:hypothetical protein